MRCPHCQSTVEPARTSTGDLLCPACHNTGRPVGPGAAPFQAAAPAPAPSLPPPPPAAPVPGIAVASMVVGIVGVLFLFTVFLAPVSFLLGIVALALGIPALRRVKAMAAPGVRLPGRPIAVTGIATGGVATAIGLVAVVAFAVLFSWISEYEPAEDAIEFDEESAGPGGTLMVTSSSGFDTWDEFELTGTADCDLPLGDVDVGDTIECFTDGSVRLREVATGQTWYSGAV